MSRLLLAEVTPRLSRSDFAPALAAEGHEGQFRPPSLSGRCRLDEATLAGMGDKEEDAPKPAIRRVYAESRILLLGLKTIDCDPVSDTVSSSSFTPDRGP